MTRKAQPSRREQPATPASGSVLPRGEVIGHDNEGKLEEDHRRHVQPQGLSSTQQPGQMVSGFRIKLCASVFVSERWKRAGES